MRLSLALSELAPPPAPTWSLQPSVFLDLLASVRVGSVEAVERYAWAPWKLVEALEWKLVEALEWKLVEALGRCVSLFRMAHVRR